MASACAPRPTALGRWLATWRGKAARYRPLLALVSALVIGGSLLLACAPTAAPASPSSPGARSSPASGDGVAGLTCLSASFLCQGASWRPMVAEHWKGIIKVAVVAPYSGSATTLGLGLLAGAQAAADELNRSGGVSGYRILILAPDERNAATPRDVAEDPAVVAVIGHLLPTGQSTADLYRRAGLPWLATLPSAGGVDQPLLVPSVAVLEHALAGYLRQEAGWSGEDARAVADRCLGTVGGDGFIREQGVWLICRGQPEDLAPLFADAPPGVRLVCVPLWCASPELAAWSAGVSYDYFDLVNESSGAAAGAQEFDGEQRAAAAPQVARLGYRGIELIARAVARAATRGGVSRRSVAAALGDRTASDRASAQSGKFVVRRSQGQYPGPIIFQPRGLPS